MTHSNLPIGNKVVMISGYRGLAASLIRAFECAGFDLSILVRRESALAQLQSDYPNALLVVGDVSVAEHCQSWVNQTQEKFGGIDVLINNAAVTGPPGRMHELDFDAYQECLDINLTSPARLMHLAIPYLLKSDAGTIINLSGGGATFSRPRFSAYATAKCGIVRLTECVADEYPELAVYAISPGALATPMLEAVASMDPELVGKDHAMAQARLEDGGEDPMKAANLCVWLSSECPKHLRGRLVSAIHDQYKTDPSTEAETDWWRLRRIDEVSWKKLQNPELNQEERDLS